MRFRSLALLGLLPAPGVAQSLEESVLGLLQAKCASCHNLAAPASGFSVHSKAAILAGGARRGAAVKPGNPKESPLAGVLRGEITPKMPLGGNLEPDQIKMIEEWIGTLRTEAATTTPTRYWAFQRPGKAPPPEVRSPGWARGEIDRFLLSELEEKKLTPSPEADRPTLIRRLYAVLIGLTPPPEEVKAFSEDSSPKAYEELVDRLLADPRYGERWARHWLDVARYADTNGYEGDHARPWAWRYRDYVIDAFNNDKPYDLFILEQIAGDELNPVNSADMPAPAEPEKVVALTFLRLGAFNRTPVSDENRDSLLSEMTATVGSTFLGLTIGCAKCHDHKYDMVPIKDFYRMKAFFTPVQINTLGLKNDLAFEGGGEAAEYYRPGDKDWVHQRRAELSKEQSGAQSELKELQKALLEKITNSSKAEKRKEVKDLEILIESGKASIPPVLPEERTRYKSLKEILFRLENSLTRLLPMAMALRSADGPPMAPSIPPTHLLIRGEHDRPGEIVEPGFLSAIEGHQNPAPLDTDRWNMFPGRGRRSALAKWIASPANPLTARVMVNRLWQYNFGRGLVETSSDFGRNGTPPTHPELLDFLAERFVESKWSIKAMQRLMLTSAAFRQSSRRADAAAELADPDNRLLWRFPRRRLEGEAIRDSVLAVSGRLNPDRRGPPVFPALPGGLDTELKVKNVNTWETSSGPETRKRSIYIYQRRSLSFPFLEVFDAPVLSGSCDRRRSSITPLQALAMYDSDFVNEEARHLAARIKKETGVDRTEQVQHAFLLMYGRVPTREENTQTMAFLDRLPKEADGLAVLCRALYNTNEFVYID